MTNIPSWAVVGAKVVCVNSKPNPGTVWTNGDGLVEQEIYVIRRVFVNARGAPSLDLEGCERSLLTHLAFGFYVGYGITRFRPLINKTLEEDMEMFVPLLKIVREEELV